MSDRLLDGVRYTSLKEPNLNNTQCSVLIAAEFAGSANCLAPVAKLFASRGVGVVFQTRTPAEEIINKQFEREELGQGLPNNINWVLLSGGEHLEFETEAVKISKRANPSSKVAVVEDSPTSVDRVIDAVLKAGFEPDLILTTTRRLAAIYRHKYLLNAPTIPIGQPSFDHLFTEDTLSLSQTTREVLSVSPTDKVITYLGLRGGAFPQLPNGGYPDFDSYILCETAKATASVARSHREDKFVLINRPHPGSPEKLWRNPELAKMTGLPDNLRIISVSKPGWEFTRLTTREITAASDLAVNVASTVGQEVALAGARPNQDEVRTLPLHILPDYALQFFWGGEFALGETGATAIARNISEIPAEIERSLYDQDYRAAIVNNQQPLISDFRFKASSSKRVVLWMRAVDRYGSDVTRALNVFKR